MALEAASLSLRLMMYPAITGKAAGHCIAGAA